MNPTVKDKSFNVKFFEMSDMILTNANENQPFF